MRDRMRRIVIFLSLLICMGYSLFAMNPKVIIMLGAPGAGKGTQALIISEEHNIPQISTGDLFRENMRNNTPIGQKAKSYMEKGDLVPDEVVLEMLLDRLQKEDCKNGYILDGFPRTLPQAEALTQRLGADARILALCIEVPDDIIVERLTGRRVCEKCGAPYHIVAAKPKKEGVCDRCGGSLIQRKDDTEEVIRERIGVYHAQSEPLKEYYKKLGKLALVDGTSSKEKTITQIQSSLKQFLQ